MDAVTWLFIANAIIWAGIGGYVALIGHCQGNLARQIKQLELARNDGDK